jgi:hypothetical protein
MKIGLCVVLNNDNFGSMLQSYATQSILYDMGFDFELIEYKKKYTLKQFVKWLPRLFNPILLKEKKLSLSKRLRMLMSKDFKQNCIVRKKAFSSFRADYFLHKPKIYVGYSELLKAGKKFDAYIVGSDQLWSPSGLPTNFYNLVFSDSKKVKIAYASSFGVSKIPFYQRKRTAKYLSRLEFISVREISGQCIVKDLINKEVPIVADPSLLYTAQEWSSKLCSTAFEFKKPYIFAFFLGPNPTHRELVCELANKTGFIIVTVRHMDQYIKADIDFGDYSPYTVGPADFFHIVKNAEFICTDSYHGTIFSILNHKRFITFDRYTDNAIDSKNTRIDSLLEMTGLLDRRYCDDIEREIKKNIDYDTVDKKLNQFRNFSKEYLMDALKRSMS